MRLMVKHRDADDLSRCPRAHLLARQRGVALPAPGLDLWRVVVDAVRSAHRAGDTGSFPATIAHVTPAAGAWRAPEERAEVEALIEAYLDLHDELGGDWLEPPEQSLQLPSRDLPVVLDGSFHLAFTHGPAEFEVRKLEISAFHLPPGDDDLRTEFSTCLLALLAQRWRPDERVRVTLVSLRGRRAVSTVWEKLDFALARDIVRNWVLDRLERRDFAPALNPLCGSCGHARGCPAIASPPEPSRIRAAVTTGEAPPAAPPDWVVLSPARRRLFDQCPRRFRNRYLLGLNGEDPEGSDATGTGLAVHRALAETHATDPAGHRGLDAACARAAADLEVDEERVRACATAHLELCPGDGYLGGEIDLYAFLTPGLLVQGRVDALWETADGGIEVRDYKTGSAEEDLGVATYAVLAAAAYPERRPVRVALEDLAAARLAVREFGPSQLEAASERVATAAAEMYAAADYPGRPSPLCAGCGFRASCPDATPDLF